MWPPHKQKDQQQMHKHTNKTMQETTESPQTARRVYILEEYKNKTPGNLQEFHPNHQILEIKEHTFSTGGPSSNTYIYIYYVVSKEWGI